MDLEVVSASLTYLRRRQRVVALDRVSLAVPSGWSLGVTGPSGSGKSSLLYVLSGLRVPSDGIVKACGIPLGQAMKQKIVIRQRDFGFIFQQHLLLNYLTVSENVLAAALPLAGGRPAGKRLADLVDFLGLTGLQEAFPHQISVGQRQRVAVARALINQPAVVFADEPTASLDEDNALQVMSLLDTYRRKWGATVVVVSHNPGLVAAFDRVVTLVDGRLSTPDGGGV